MLDTARLPAPGRGFPSGRLPPLCLPIHPLTLSLLSLLALVGLVGQLHLPHQRGAGRALRLLVRRARSLALLDDGLDQYRQSPRALDPEAFAAGTPLDLFSDVPRARASWCNRFTCRELGPLYPHRAGAAPTSGRGSLLIDSPGLERLTPAEWQQLTRPWTLCPHPVVAKRRCPGWLGPGDRVCDGEPEELLPGWSGTVVVGESMLLLAAMRTCSPSVSLWIVLPSTADPQLRLLVAQEMERRLSPPRAGAPAPPCGPFAAS